MWKTVFLLLAAWCATWAQVAPVVLPRGIINAITQLPAPATVGRGGIIQISGLNLGPPEGAQAAGPQWPTQLADVQVLINGNPAPLASVSPGTIVAQVPADAAVGVADLVVTRTAGTSLAAHFTVLPVDPAIRSADGSGWGQAFGAVAGQTLTLSGSGLGPANAATGSLSTPLVAFIGGIRTTATATPSATRTGEFDIQLPVPAGAQPGDLITLMAGARMANQTTYQSMSAPTVNFLAMPDGAPDFQAITDTDLDGNFLIGTSAKDSNGCAAGVIFDFLKRSATLLPDCLTTAARDPVVQATPANVLAALIGPPTGTPPTASSAAIYGPTLSSPMTVTLPNAATALTAAAGGNFCAVIPTQPPQTVTIDAQTGQTSNQPCGGGGLAALAGGGMIPNLNVGGLTVQISPAVALGQGRSAVLAADDAAQPTQVAFAVVNQNGQAVLTKAFPDGWLPMITPLPMAGPGGGTAPAPRFRTASFLDATGRLFYVLVNNGDNSQQGFVSFPLDQSDAKFVAFPGGWFAAACTPAIAIFDLQLSGSKVLAGARDGTIGARTTCSADGFLLLDLGQQTVSVVPLPAQAQMDVRALGSLNDYVYSTNPTVGRNAVTSAIYALDGATGSPLPTLGPPSFITGFNPLLQPVAQLNWLITEASSKAQGDGGLLVFDLDNQVANLLPLPDGFDSVIAQGAFVATRKVVALGTRSGGAGSQFVIYNLETSDFNVVPNPPRAAFVGGRAPARAGAPGAGGGAAALALRGLISANPNANTISAVGTAPDGKQMGVMVVRIP